MPLFEKKCWDSFCTFMLFVVFVLVTGCEGCEATVEPSEPGTEIDPTNCMTPTPEQNLFVVIDTDFIDEISCFVGTDCDLRDFYDMASPTVDAWYTGDFFGDPTRYYIDLTIGGFCESGEMFIETYTFDDFEFASNDIANFFVPQFEKGGGTLSLSMHIRTPCCSQLLSCPDNSLDCPGGSGRATESIRAFKELVITSSDSPEVWFDKNDFFVDMVDCECY